MIRRAFGVLKAERLPRSRGKARLLFQCPEPGVATLPAARSDALPARPCPEGG